MKKFEVGKMYSDWYLSDSPYIAYRIDKRTDKTITYTEILKPCTPYRHEGETKRVKLRTWGRNGELEAFFGQMYSTIQSDYIVEI